VALAVVGLAAVALLPLLWLARRRQVRSLPSGWRGGTICGGGGRRVGR
jgi:hypothetical protein